ncbi:MAG: DUF2794 domain-containing protein [Kiloniellales bacterium]
MPQVLGYAARRRRPTRVFFSRQELDRLLSLYSRRVMAGEWRDYAIDHADGVAVFSVFRHSFERPLYAIAKRPTQGGGRDQFLLLCAGRVLRRSDRIDQVLPNVEHRFRVVS